MLQATVRAAQRHAPVAACVRGPTSSQIQPDIHLLQKAPCLGRSYTGPTSLLLSDPARRSFALSAGTSKIGSWYLGGNRRLHLRTYKPDVKLDMMARLTSPRHSGAHGKSRGRCRTVPGYSASRHPQPEMPKDVHPVPASEPVSVFHGTSRS